MNRPDPKTQRTKKNKLSVKRQVQINIGQSWLEHVRHLSDLSSTHRFDFCEFFDIVDIIVNGVNLSACIENEYIIPFFLKLNESLNRLADGSSKKVIVEFQREPWELVLVRNNDEVLISVLSVDSQMRVVCLDEPANFASFYQEVERVSLAILAELSSLVGGTKMGNAYGAYGAHDEISRLKASLSVRKISEINQVDEERVDESLITLGLSLPGFNFSMGLESTHAFRAYQPENAFDLHSLLLPGELHFEFGDSVFSGGEYPFISLSVLLKYCEEWITFFSESVAFEHEILNPFHLHVHQKGHRLWEVGKTKGSRAEVDAGSFIEAILSLAKNFAEKLEELNSTIIVNQRYCDFQDLTLELIDRWEDLSAKDLFNEEPDLFLKEFAGLMPNAPTIPSPSFRFDFGNLRAIHPAHQWTFLAERIYFSQIFSQENTLFVPTKEGFSALDIESGELEWQSKVSDRSGPVFPHENKFFQRENKGLRSFSCLDGRELASVEETRQIFSMHAYDNTLIFSSSESVFARHANDLAEIWSYPVKRKLGTGAVAAGPVYALMSNAGVLHALNPVNGDCLWKVKVSGTIVAPPYIHASRVFTCVQDAYRFRISARLAFTGREAWSFEEEGAFGGELFFTEQCCIFSIERNGGVEVVALCLKNFEVAWRQSLSSPRGYFPSFLSVGTRVIMQSNSGEIKCLDCQSGELVWHIPKDQTPFLHPNFPAIAVRDAFISHKGSIEIRGIGNGELIGRLGDTLIEAQYFEIFNPLNIVSGERGEGFDQDRLVSFTIEHFLAMVDLSSDT